MKLGPPTISTAHSPQPSYSICRPAVGCWLALAFWVHRDARRRIQDPVLVFLATLLGVVPPYVGPLVYLLFRPSEALEDVRSRRVELQVLEEQLARARQACPVCSS